MVYFLNELLGTISDACEGRTWYQLHEVMSLDVIPSNAIILRLDVERSLRHHVSVAKDLAKAGIFCTIALSHAIRMLRPRNSKGNSRTWARGRLSS